MFGLGAIVCGLGSALCGALSSAGAAIGGALSTGIGALGGLFKGAVGVLGKIGVKAGGYLKNLLKIIRGPLGPMGPIICDEHKDRIAEFLWRWVSDQFKEKENLEDIGYRLEEANKPENSDWKKPEEFDSFEDYYYYLKEQIPDSELHKDKKREWEYECIGFAGLSDVASKKERINITPSFLDEAARSNMSAGEVRAIIDAFKALGYDNVAIKDYFVGTGSPEERHRIYLALLDALSKQFPELSLLSISERINIMRKCSLDDKFMAENSYADVLKDIAENGENSAGVKKALENQRVLGAGE